VNRFAPIVSVLFIGVVTALGQPVLLETDVPFRGLIVAMTPPDEPKRSDEDVRARSNALVAINDVKALAAYHRAGTRELNATDEEVAAIKVPVLGIIDSLDNVRSMDQLKTVLPALNLVVIVKPDAMYYFELD
jgi:hypothetical protein